MDADVYGPSIPKMINLKGPVHLNKRKILLLFLQCNTTFLTVVCDAVCELLHGEISSL